VQRFIDESNQGRYATGLAGDVIDQAFKSNKSLFASIAGEGKDSFSLKQLETAIKTREENPDGSSKSSAELDVLKYIKTHFDEIKGDNGEISLDDIGKYKEKSIHAAYLRSIFSPEIQNGDKIDIDMVNDRLAGTKARISVAKGAGRDTTTLDAEAAA